jgi:hypothetical protein
MCAQGAEDVRKYAAQQSLTEEDAVKRGLEEKPLSLLRRAARCMPKLKAEGTRRPG